MIDERRAIVRSLYENFFDDGSNHFLCARILLEQIKLELLSGNTIDMYEFLLCFSVKEFVSPSVMNQIIWQIIFVNVHQL